MPSKQQPDRPPEATEGFLAPIWRKIISLLLLTYLGVLLLGPLSNPIASEHLTGPLARAVAPVHRVLFQGHGYRFFAPEPGPGHFVECRFKMKNGSESISRFPDRDQHQPRLLYHRWFMLAETLFTELDGTPDAESFADAQAALRREVLELRSVGKLKPAKLLSARIDFLDQEYERTRKRVDNLLRSVATAVLKEHPDAESVELVLFERVIPLPADVTNGVKLDDPRYLSPPVSIGHFTRQSVEPKTVETTSDPSAANQSLEEIQ